MFLGVLEYSTPHYFRPPTAAFCSQTAIPMAEEIPRYEAAVSPLSMFPARTDAPFLHLHPDSEDLTGRSTRTARSSLAIRWKPCRRSF